MEFFVNFSLCLLLGVKGLIWNLNYRYRQQMSTPITQGIQWSESQEVCIYITVFHYTDQFPIKYHNSDCQSNEPITPQARVTGAQRGKMGDSASFSRKLWHEMSELSISCILRTFTYEWKSAMWCITVPVIFFFHLRTSTSTLFALFRSLLLLAFDSWKREKRETHRGERKMSVSPFLRGVIFTRALLSRKKNGDYSSSSILRL